MVLVVVDLKRTLGLIAVEFCTVVCAGNILKVTVAQDKENQGHLRTSMDKDSSVPLTFKPSTFL